MSSTTFNNMLGSDAYGIGISIISNPSAARLWAEGSLTVNRVRNNNDLRDDINDGMDIYSVKAFGRNTLVSAFGPLGIMSIASNGGISFSNPTAAAYLDDAVIMGLDAKQQILPTIARVISEKRIIPSIRLYTKMVVKGNTNYEISYDIRQHFKSITKYSPIGSITVGYSSVMIENILSVGADENNYNIDFSIPMQNSSVAGVTFSFDKEMTNQIMSYGWAVSFVFEPELRLIPIPIY